MSFWLFCAILWTTSPISDITFRNIESIIKSNVNHLRTLNIVKRFTLMLSNSSTLSIDELLTVLSNFVHKFTYSRPYLSKHCINHKIECYTSMDIKYSTIVHLFLSNSSTLYIYELVTILCNFVHNFTYWRPYLSKQCINRKIECYTSNDTKYSTMVHCVVFELLNSLHRCASDGFVQFRAQLNLFTS